MIEDVGLTEIEYNHLYNYAAFKRYPTGSSKNQCCLIWHKYFETFCAEDGVQASFSPLQEVMMAGPQEDAQQDRSVHLSGTRVAYNCRFSRMWGIVS